MSKLKDSRNGEVVTFDFDNTLVKSFLNKTIQGEEHYEFGGVNPEIAKRIKKFKDSGTTVFIVTARDQGLDVEESSVNNLLNRLGIEVDAVFYTNGQTKAQKLYELGSKLHYDDDPKEHEAIESLKKVIPEFQIVVKYPDELLEDIEEIAKGLIITADNEVIIVQRSDSYEWDAIGGHLMQGEEGAYAFWRETKEELGLEVNEVRYLDTLETTWKGVTKDSHYFLGRTDWSSDELETQVDIQWELADYFCGTFEEVREKAEGNMTQNLKNALRTTQNQIDLLDLNESYQDRKKNSKKHKIMKKRILGLGGSKTTGAKGLKRIKNFKRAKSAPPGAPGGGWPGAPGGPAAPALEESDDPKPQKKIKISIISDIEEKKKRKKKKKKKKTNKGNSYWPYWATVNDSGSGSGGDGGSDGGGGGE